MPFFFFTCFGTFQISVFFFLPWLLMVHVFWTFVFHTLMFVQRKIIHLLFVVNFLSCLNNFFLFCHPFWNQLAIFSVVCKHCPGRIWVGFLPHCSLSCSCGIFCSVEEQECSLTLEHFLCETVNSGVLERCWKVVQSSFQLIPSNSRPAFWADTWKNAVGGNPMGISGFAYWNPPVRSFLGTLFWMGKWIAWPGQKRLLPPSSVPLGLTVKVFANTARLPPCAGLFSIARRLTYSSKEKCFKIGNPKLVRGILWVWLPRPTHVHLSYSSFCPAGEEPDESYICTKFTWIYL